MAVSALSSSPRFGKCEVDIRLVPAFMEPGVRMQIKDPSFYMTAYFKVIKPASH